MQNELDILNGSYTSRMPRGITGILAALIFLKCCTAM